MEYLFIFLIIGLLSVLLTVCVLKISKGYENYINMRVQDRIGWWLIGDSINVLDYIQKKSIDLKIEEKYLITTESEKKIALEIIEKYQTKSRYLYLECSNFANIKLATMPHSDFFMYYLEKHLSEFDSCYYDENEMYVETSKEHYDNGSCDVRCIITDYGMVFTKLKYMARFYCEKNSKLNKNNTYYSEGIKKELDTKEITFWHHHL